MIFENLKCLNFLTLNTVDLSLENKGLVTVSGVNKVNTSSDSNGAGKTSIAEAICWCLFGKTSRGVSADDIIRSGQKSAQVTLTLKDETHTYTIVRERSKGKGITQVTSLDKNGATVNLTRGTEALTQAEICRIIGCDYEVFCAAVYMAQEEMVCLPTLNDRMLKEIVEEAAGLTKLAAAFEIAKAEASDALKAAEIAEGNFKDVEMRLSSAGDTLRSAQDSNAKAKASADYANEERRKKLESAIKTIEADIAATRYDVPALDAAIAKLEAKLSEMSDGKHDEWLKKISACEVDISVAESEYMKARKETRFQELRLEQSRDRIGQPCGECGSIITEEHLKDVCDSIRAKINASKDCEKRAQLAYTEAERRKNSIKAEEPEKVDTSSIYTKIKTLSLAKDKLLSKTKLLEGYKKDLDAPKIEAVMIETKALEKNLEKLLEQRREALIKLGEAREKSEKAAKVKSIFDVGGVRAEILDQITPFLNERTAEYLAVLADGTVSVEWTTLLRKKDGSLKEKFSIEVKHSESGKGFKSCSGGERRRISLACSFALQDLVASRATKPLKLLVADEIDDALDVPGLERLMVVMQGKAKDRGTVLVISHNDLKSWIGNSITVIKEAGGSKVIDD